MTSHRNNRRAHHRVAAKREELEPATPVKKLDARFSPTATFADPDAQETTNDSPGGDIFSQILGGQETTTETTISTTVSTPETTSSTTPSTTSTTSSTPTPTPTSTTSISTTSTVATPTSTPLPNIDARPTTTSQTVVHATQFTTVSNSASRSLSSSASPSSTSAASNADDTSSSSTGMIAGGIGAGIVVLGGIIFAVIFFVRRNRRRAQEDGGNPFNPDTFRRSAVILDDEGSSRFNRPRAPSMIERKMAASPAPTFGTQYANGQAPAGYLEHGPGLYNQQQPSFAPGQIFDAASPPATTAHALYDDGYNNSGYNNFSPASPVSSNVPNYSTYNDQPASPYLTRQPSTNNTVGAGSGLERKPSFAAMAAYPIKHVPVETLAQDAYLARRPSDSSAHGITPSDYADLTRSSVTPFQAAQYAAISNTLKTEVPQGLDTPAIDQFVGSRMPMLPSLGEEEPPVVPSKETDVSPFTSPEDFPAPPSVFIAPQTRHRVDSFPPMLPEISLQRDSQALDVPGAVVTPGMLNTDSPLASRFNFPTTPSPMASQFPTTPSPMASSFSHQDMAIPIAAPPAARVVEDKKRPDTIYDEADAYGGI